MAQKIEKILKFVKATRHFSPYYIVEVTKVWLMNIYMERPGTKWLAHFS